MRCPSSSSSWTSFSSRWARAWDDHEVVDLAVGCMALHYAEENPDAVAVALCGPTSPEPSRVSRTPHSHSIVLRDGSALISQRKFFLGTRSTVCLIRQKFGLLI
jgi:hypothetical protein